MDKAQCVALFSCGFYAAVCSPIPGDFERTGKNAARYQLWLSVPKVLVVGGAMWRRRPGSQPGARIPWAHYPLAAVVHKQQRTELPSSALFLDRASWQVGLGLVPLHHLLEHLCHPAHRWLRLTDPQ